MVFKVEILKLYLNDLQINLLFIYQILEIVIYPIILLVFDLFLELFLLLIYLVILAVLLTFARVVSYTFSPYLFLVFLVTARRIYPIFNTRV